MFTKLMRKPHETPRCIQYLRHAKMRDLRS